MELGFKIAVLALAFILCTEFQAAAQDGSAVDDVRKSFRGESIFYIDPSTGMSPGVPGPGVRYPPVVVNAVPLTNAAGTWYIKLQDVYTREMYLNLTQSGSAIQGSATVRIGEEIVQATVSGTAFWNRMSLYVTPAGGQGVYSLSLTVTSTSISGNYVYSAQGREQPGIAYGGRTSAQSLSSPQASTYAQPYVQQSSILLPNSAYRWDT